MNMPPTPAVLAEDLRALADGPFDRLTTEVLLNAADALDPDEAPENTPAKIPAARPSYEDIADAIQDALDSGLYELNLTQDGRPAELWQLARCLDKAGLIDPRAAVKENP